MKKAKVTNADLLVEMKTSKEAGQPTETLGKMFIWIANYHGNKPQHQLNPLREDMVAFAILQMVKSYNMFNPEKSDNPFAYLVTIAGCAFANVNNQERRERHNE
jgi:hypothetical protein